MGEMTETLTGITSQRVLVGGAYQLEAAAAALQCYFIDAEIRCAPGTDYLFCAFAQCKIFAEFGTFNAGFGKCMFVECEFHYDGRTFDNLGEWADAINQTFKVKS